MTQEELDALALVQQAQQLNRQASQQHNQELDVLVDVGRTHYGTRAFDEAAAAVVGVLGEKKDQVTTMLRELEKPQDVLMHLAENEAQLKALVQLSPARQRTELARIEARMTSYGHVPTGSEREWIRPESRTGRTSDQDWKASFGSNLSDRQWNAEFDRRQAAKGRR